MRRNRLAFRVSHLFATVPDGVPLRWQGEPLRSGPLTIERAPDANDRSRGVMDYESGRATVAFHVLLRFPELVAALEGLGVDPALARPVRAVLRSEGPIEDDHRLRLSGRCELLPHELFRPDESAASVLPGH